MRRQPEKNPSGKKGSENQSFFAEMYSKGTDWKQADFPPLWRAAAHFTMQLFLVVATIFVTYWLAPKVNEDFEIEKRRSAFYESALTTLGGDARDLVGDLTIYVDPKFPSEQHDQLRLKIRRTISRLIWQRVEFVLIFPEDKEVQAAMKDYNESLLGLGKLMQQPITQESTGNILEQTRAFGLATSQMMRILARRAKVT